MTGVKLGSGTLFMPDLRFSEHVETVLKRLREDLAHVNASILSLEYIEAGERGGPGNPPKCRQPRESDEEETGSSEHSDRMKPKQPTSPLAEGYAEAHLAAHWSEDCEFWSTFMRKVIRLPLWMLPIVQLVIRRRAWRRAADPLQQIRAASNREAARLGSRGG